MYRLCLVLTCAIALLMPAAVPVAALPATARTHELVVKLRDERALAPGGLLDRMGARDIQSLGLGSQTYRVAFAPRVNIGALLPTLRRDPAVTFAEANVTRAVMRTAMTRLPRSSGRSATCAPMRHGKSPPAVR